MKVTRVKRDLLLMVLLIGGLLALATAWGALCGALGFAPVVSLLGGMLIGAPAGPVLAMLALDLYGATRQAR